MNASSKRGASFGLIVALAWLTLSGCAGTGVASGNGSAIHVGTAVASSAAKSADDDKRAALRIATYLDHRAVAPSRKIGNIRATVVDMHVSELVLDEDIPSAVTAAVGNMLDLRGFHVATTNDGVVRDGAAAFQVSGSVRKFALDIGGRDQLTIEVETTLRDGGGRVLWSGLVSETGDRYAGVTGNTKESITRYLTAGLKTVADQTSVRVSDAAHQARPDLFPPQSPAAENAVPGEVVAVPPMASAPWQSKGHSDDAQTFGRLSIVTTPPRAKVYLGDVYWGLSPLNLELAPNIYSLRFTMNGYKTATEKVSVRKAATTELEIELEK